MKVIKQALLSFIAGFAITASSMAADINLSVDPNNDTFTLTNTLRQAVHVISLGSNSTYLGLSLDLSAGGSRTVKYHGALPVLDFARCLSPDGVKLTDRTPSKQGYYDLSLSIQ